jgi:hypothetical protein
MENKRSMSGTMEKTGRAVQGVAETMGDTIVAVIDKLAGTRSDLKLSFEDLTFDTGIFKARMNGAIILDVIMAKEAEASS